MLPDWFSQKIFTQWQTPKEILLHKQPSNHLLPALRNSTCNPPQGAEGHLPCKHSLIASGIKITEEQNRRETAFSTSTANDLLLHFTQLHHPDELACFRLSSRLYRLIPCNRDALVTEAEQKTKQSRACPGRLPVARTVTPTDWEIIGFLLDKSPSARLQGKAASQTQGLISCRLKEITQSDLPFEHCSLTFTHVNTALCPVTPALLKEAGIENISIPAYLPLEMQKQLKMKKKISINLLPLCCKPHKFCKLVPQQCQKTSQQVCPPPGA